jgi:hypothetical protein
MDNAVMESADDRIRTWALLGDNAVADLKPLYAALGDLPGGPHDRRALMSLSAACLGSTTSVLYLVAGKRLWDAELVMRSVIEGTLKFGYLLETPADFSARCGEYREALPALAKLKRHKKAREAIAALADSGEAGARPYRDVLLEEPELAEIRTTYPHDMRRDLERRWGFPALVRSVSAKSGAFGPTTQALWYSYAVASELQHMSHDGTEMLLERDSRPKDNRQAIELAHAAKLVGDCFHLATLRVVALLRFLGRPTEAALAVNDRHAPLTDELAKAYSDWLDIEYSARQAS